jgi:HK97 family phage portal protein
VKLLGWTITRKKEGEKALQAVDNRGGRFSLIRESFAGAWQRNIEIRVDSILTHSAVFRCISLISSDIAKMRIRLVAQDSNGIWTETDNPAFSPVLRKPNRYQTRIQFFANWVESKLVHGNTYVLKERDARNVVTRLYVLDPQLVTVLVAPDGSVYYQLRTDHLSGIQTETIAVPASEIIHDRWNTLRHPLVGTSPISACGLAAIQGISIQNSSAKFFEHGGRPAGILTAPGHINEDTARRLKEYWDTNYGSGGAEVGRTAVLGDGLEYKPMVMTAVDAQLIEQLKWSAETVCSVFGIPAHMAGIGQPPTYNNIEALNQQYYSQCLQSLIENIELLLDEGLELPQPYGTEFDLDDLLRMDTATKVRAAADAVGSGTIAPNEARRRYFDLGPTQGGESPYLQVQNYSLAALAKRDQNSNPVTPGLDQLAAEAEPAAPSIAEEAEARRMRALRAATRAFHRLADAERVNAKLVH